MNKKGKLLTGATGCLGRELVREFLQTTDDDIYLVVRRQNRFTHWDRIRKILSGYGCEHYLGTRVHVLEGDITFSKFGLSKSDLETVRRNVHEFFHVAALTALNGSEADCDRINRGGAEHALDLAWELKREGVLERFFYFSTAYVAGSKQTYHSKEDELPKNPMHANYYESSKFQAEGLVRKAMAEGLPTTIFRPSVVVGDSKTGEVSEFNVIYPFMKLFAHGILSILPTRLDNTVNIVPIDFVISASVEIAKQPDSLGKTFHLVTPNPPNIGEMLRLKDECFPQLAKITVIPPDDFTIERLSDSEKMVYAMLDPYLGYLNDQLTFDMSNTQEALKGTSVDFPVTDFDFLKIIIEYAMDQGYIVAPA